MKTTMKVVITTAIVAIAAFVLGANGPVDQQTDMWAKMWPWGEGQTIPEPTNGQLPFFIVLSLVEAVGLGLAVSYLAFGRDAVDRLAGTGGWRRNSLYFGGAWLLGNWWLHDGLHINNGVDLAGLLVIEYVFHVTLIVTGALLCFALATLATGKATTRSTAATTTIKAIR